MDPKPRTQLIREKLAAIRVKRGSYETCDAAREIMLCLLVKDNGVRRTGRLDLSSYNSHVIDHGLVWSRMSNSKLCPAAQRALYETGQPVFVLIDETIAINPNIIDQLAEKFDKIMGKLVTHKCPALARFST